MTEIVKFVVMPFRKAGKKLVGAEQREARNAASAERLAENMSTRFAGVAAYQMILDDETGEMSEARLLVRYGEVVDFLEEA